MQLYALPKKMSTYWITGNKIIDLHREEKLTLTIFFSTNYMQLVLKEK